ncbi:MAG: hypothetical protein OXU75_14500 [Deltaproteobacteria bacterium]|nr:hypothetical protein [Deltaproteobacteria bacterium]
MIPFAAGGIGLGTKLLAGGVIVAVISGIFLAGVQSISNGGYAKAEAARRAVIAQQNATALKRERQLNANARAREVKVRAQLEAELRAVRTAIAPPPSGIQCRPGCKR